MSKKEVYVELPKFKVTSKLTLTEVFKSMGLHDAFLSPPAYFSGIDGTKNFFISAVIHEAVVDVTEKGTEAAAATSTVMRAPAAVSSPMEFKADHPFFFLIRHTKTNGIVFWGRLINLGQ